MSGFLEAIGDMTISSNDTIFGHFFPSVVWPAQMMLTAENSKAAFLTARSEDYHPSSSVSKPQLWYAGLGSLLGHQADCKNVGE